MKFDLHPFHREFHLFNYITIVSEYLRTFRSFHASAQILFGCVVHRNNKAKKAAIHIFPPSRQQARKPPANFYKALCPASPSTITRYTRPV